jgi:hypothetical protein
MAFGIDFTLTTPIPQSVTIDGFVVTDMTLDFDAGELVIAYDRLNDSRVRLAQERSITVDGQAAVDAFARAEEVAGNNGETVIRALYYVAHELVRDALSLTGTINVT